MKFTAFITALAVFSISDQVSAVRLQEPFDPTDLAQIGSESMAHKSTKAVDCAKCPCCKPENDLVDCCAPDGIPGTKGG